MNMPWLIFSLLWTVPQPDHCPELAATYAEGATWQFQLKDDKGELYKTTTYKVDEIYDEGERVVYSIKYITTNKKGKEEDKGNRNLIAAANQYLVDVESMIPGYMSDDPVNLSLPCNPAPGNTVGEVNKVSTYTVDNLGQKSYVSNKIRINQAKFGNRETIVSPLGELDCIVFTYTVNLDLQEFTYTDWIDSSLRTVQREIKDKKGKVVFTGSMVSYSK